MKRYLFVVLLAFIAGCASLKNSSPDNALFIIDGNVLSKTAAHELKEEQIESITVLKGKSARRLYGKRGKNGVVLITTKK